MSVTVQHQTETGFMLNGYEGHIRHEKEELNMGKEKNER